MNAAIEIPTIPGTAFGGGFYAGRLFIDGEAHALISAPKFKGEIASIIWSGSLALVDATSYCNGLANTQAMAHAGSELAQQIIALRIGGFDDWHLPSRLQLLVAYHELAKAEGFAEDEAEAFEPDWYWSSTQHVVCADYAWCQYFGSGYQNDGHKDDELRARAVRAIKI